MIDPKDPQSIADNPDAIRVLALEAKKDLGPLLQVVGQAVVLHDLDPMWLEYVARHYAEAHKDIPAPRDLRSVLDGIRDSVYPQCNAQAVVASTPWTSDEKRRTAADALARFLAQGGIHR